MAKGFTITIRLEGGREARVALSRLPLHTKEEIKKQVSASSLAVQRGAKMRVVVDTGRLRNSIRATYYQDGLTADVGTDVFYAPFIEFGTRPHPTSQHPGVPRKAPPPGVLEDWIRRHKLDIEEFQLRQIIKQRGTPARPFLYPAYADEKPKFIRGVREAVQRAGRKVSRSSRGRAA